MPKIVVFGVGGAGGNAINNMIRYNLEGVEFAAANTDAQVLVTSLAQNKIQLGSQTTKGLGAGAVPEVGKKAAEESAMEIESLLRDASMVFITAGMGGGTGTGAAPCIAKIAKEKEILTVGVVTKPFHFEGMNRMRIAEDGIKELQKYVDTLIVIPNQNLFRVATEKTSFVDAFRIADDVLHSGVRGITDLITMPGLINLDFADIKSIMRKMGRAMMGSGEATGEDRAVKAADMAITNPLLDNASMRGARGVLINITGGADMTLFEVEDAVNRIRAEVEEDANIIFGSIFNPDMEGSLRVSVVATGIDSADTAAGSKSTENKVTNPYFSQLNQDSNSGSRSSNSNQSANTFANARQESLNLSPQAQAVLQDIESKVGGNANFSKQNSEHDSDFESYYQNNTSSAANSGRSHQDNSSQDEGEIEYVINKRAMKTFKIDSEDGAAERVESDIEDIELNAFSATEPKILDYRQQVHKNATTINREIETDNADEEDGGGGADQPKDQPSGLFSLFKIRTKEILKKKLTISQSDIANLNNPSFSNKEELENVMYEEFTFDEEEDSIRQNLEEIKVKKHNAFGG